MLMVYSSAGVTIAYCTHSHSVSFDGLNECDDHCMESDCACLERITLRLSEYDCAQSQDYDFSLPQFTIINHKCPTFAEALSVENRKVSLELLYDRPLRDMVNQPMLCRFLI